VLQHAFALLCEVVAQDADRLQRWETMI